MWHSGSDSEVTCIACGAQLPRSQAREYDKYGDRWERRNKEFEFLCKQCYRECCHQPRDGLETTLVDAEAGLIDRRTFLAQYHELVEDPGEPEHER